MTALLWLSRLPAPVRGLLALAAAFLVGWAALAAHDRTQQAIGRAEERTHAALARAAAAESLAARRDTVYRRDTVRLAAAAARYGIARDTARGMVLRLDTAAADTGWRRVLAAQADALDAADTVIAACQLARLTCEQRDSARVAEIAALRATIGAQTEAAPRPSLPRRVGGALLWLGAGFALGRTLPH